MPVSQPTEATRHAAAAWHARLRGEDVDELERARFLAWLEQPGHAEAWHAHLDLWDQLEAPARQLGAGGWYRPAERRPRRRPLAWGLAAGLALCATVSVLWWRDPGLADRTLADVSTAPGATRDIRLRDGSSVRLDGDTAIDLSDGDDGRRITLRRGRVAVEVASLHTPFVVVSGQDEVHDLSTRFVVERLAQGSDVLVERGNVRIVRRGAGGEAFELHAGQRSLLTAAGADVHQADLAADTAWQRGVLVYQGDPLARVVRDLARYGAGARVTLVGERARQATVSGTFRTDDPDAALRAIAAALGLRLIRVPGVTTIVR